MVLLFSNNFHIFLPEVYSCYVLFFEMCIRNINLVPSSWKTLFVPFTKTNILIMCMHVTIVYSDNCKNHKYIERAKRGFYILNKILNILVIMPQRGKKKGYLSDIKNRLGHGDHLVYEDTTNSFPIGHNCL